MTRKKSLGLTEFVALMALMTSLTAMAIDAMLPALAQIGSELGAARENDRQWVITAVFLGLAIAQIGYGPLADRYGRKKPLYVGLAVFAVGTLIAATAVDFSAMLIGRFLQGIGSAGPRIVTTAIVRDQYKGDAMARIMSLIMAAFVMIPTIAPALGQLILYVSHWRMIFIVLLVQSMIALVWFAWRQPETLPPERRLPLHPRSVFAAFREVISHRISLGYTLVSGAVFGAFVGFLLSVQQILQEQYELGGLFPFYFAMLALTIGGSSYFNSRWVMRFGMRKLSRFALYGYVGLSFIYLVASVVFAGHPPLWSVMLYLMTTFGCIGILMSNLNALAMEPMGHIAGVAAAVIASLTTFISLILGAIIGRSYDGTVLPLITGFAFLSAISLGLTFWTEPHRSQARGAGRLR